MIETPVLGDPHLVLAHIAAHDRGRRQFRQTSQQRRRVHAFAGRVVARRGDLLRVQAGIAPGVARDAVATVQMRGRCGQHPLQADRQIALHRRIGDAQLADLAGVDIQMDHARVRRELGQLAGGAVVEARADHEQQIAFVHRQIRRAVAVHAEHAHVQRMRVRQRAQCLERQHGRDLGRIDERAERVHRIAQRDAAAGVDHRLLRQRQLRQRRMQRRVGGARRGIDLGRRVRGQMRSVGVLHVLRQIDQHRARATFACETEGLGDDVRQVVDAARQEVVLHDRHGHAEHVQFLEGVGAHQRRADLAGDADHRHRIEHRIGDAGNQVRGARSGGRDADADAAAGARIAVRRERGALLVPHQHVFEGRSVQGIVEGHDRAAGIPEQRIHAFREQRLHQPAGTVHQAVSAIGCVEEGLAGAWAAACAASCVEAAVVCGALCCSHCILARSSLPTFSIG